MNDTPGERCLAIKAVMMPRDTNPYGTIFGGVLLSYIDEAGAVGAQDEIRRAGWPSHRRDIKMPLRMGGPIVTVAVNRVEFHRPVFVGDVVSFYTELARVGRTSITMRVTVETNRHGKAIQLTEAEVTYVAVKLDRQDRHPVPIRGE